MIVPPDDRSLVERILERIAARDYDSARALIEVDGDGGVAGARYAELATRRYASRDIPGMLSIGHLGVDFLVRQAACAPDEPSATEHKTAAKTLAYNVAANCWPGSGDEGVSIQPAEIESGLALARSSVRLAVKLGLGPLERATGFWLVGALHFALGRGSEAMRDFDRSRALYQAADALLEATLVNGYRGLALRAASGTEAGDVRLIAAIAELEREGSKKAMFFASQLRTAALVLNIAE